MASTAMMTAGMVMPTQRRGSRKERSRGSSPARTPRIKPTPAPMASPMTRRLSVMSSWIQRSPSQARRPRAFAVSTGEAMKAGFTTNESSCHTTRMAATPAAAKSSRVRRATGVRDPAALLVPLWGVVEPIVGQLAADDLG